MIPAASLVDSAYAGLGCGLWVWLSAVARVDSTRATLFGNYFPETSASPVVHSQAMVQLDHPQAKMKMREGGEPLGETGETRRDEPKLRRAAASPKMRNALCLHFW